MQEKAHQFYSSSLSIHQLNAEVYLGAGEAERSVKQRVVVDVRFYLPELLSSAADDNGNYLCYHGVSEQIQALCAAKPYRLIEFLVQEIYRLVRQATPTDIKIWVRLRKAKILLEYVEGGTSVTYSDLPPFSWVVPE